MGSQEGRMSRWYRSKIGTPATTDEVYGYWAFVVGALLGVLGLVGFLTTTPDTLSRELVFAALAAGLVLLLVGPVIRLPLARSATVLAGLGVVLSAGAIAWFFTVYPADWVRPYGHTGVIGLYAAGLGAIVLGGVFVPILLGRSGDAFEEAERQVADADRQAEADADRIADLETDLAEALAEQDATDADLAVARQTIAARDESQAAFELYEDVAGDYRWRLRHRNGNVIADSGEGYASRQKATQGLRSVKTNAFGATVLVQPSEDPDPEDPPEVLVVDSQGTFERYEDAAGDHRWRLRHDNGEILADSGEGYASSSNVRRAIDTVRETARGAVALRLDPVGFEVYADEGGEFRWRLLHRNGNILADSGEGYASRSNVHRAIDTVRETATDEDAFDVYEDAVGEYRWRLVAANGETVADSGEGYASESNAEDAVDRVAAAAPDADALAVGAAAFELFEDDAGEWRWRLRARNGRTIADSGEGYTSRSDASRAVDSVKRHAPEAEEEHVED